MTGLKVKVQKMEVEICKISIDFGIDNHIAKTIPIIKVELN
jgi:hypothetical protein